MSCKIVKNTDGKIQQVLNQTGQPSTLFKEILNIPTLSLEEAIQVYQNIYSEKLQEKVIYQQLFSSIEQELQYIKQTAITNGTFMKAPNGQPTNLTETQWLQTRTNSFKEWFGDWEKSPENSSKVVDENGEPLVMFHGTPSTEITEFDRKKKIKESSGLREVADFFTSNIKLAEIYKKGEVSSEYKENIKREISKLKEAQYNVRNNRDWDRINNEISLLENKLNGTVYKTFLNVREPFRGDGKSTDQRGWNNLRLNIGYKTTVNRSDLLDALSEVNEAATLEKKYDGAIIENIADMQTNVDILNIDSEEARMHAKPYIGTVVAVWNSNQIKSATENIGTFSTETNDIRFQKAGENNNQQQNSEILNQLKKTGLAKNVYQLSNTEIEAKLIELGEENVNKNTSGFTYKGDIFINSEKEAGDTLLHEYNHIFRDFLKQNRKEVFDKGLSLIEAELKLGEKSEIKDIISYVETTQPNLTGEAKAEEILVEMLGRKGIELINEAKGKKGGILEFFAEIWEEIKKMLGLENYSNQEIMNMTLGEYVKATNVSLLKGENIADTAQQYFTRNADRLPLTLQVFSRPEFVKLQGKQVNPVTIITSLNQSGIKQIEKDLIKQVIEANYQGQKKIAYDELEATVRANIMPLERITTSSYADYGMDNLGNGDYGQAKTLILNAPVEHGVTGHFSGDFTASKRQNVKYQAKQLNDNTWVAVEEGYESRANDNNIYQFVGTAGTKEAVDEWIDTYEKVEDITTEEWRELIDLNNKKTEQGALYDKELERYNFLREKEKTGDNINKGMFGHIRVWENKERDFNLREKSNKFDKEMLDKYGGLWQDKLNPEERAKALDFIKRKRSENQIFYVAELQSDFFQKNNAKKRLILSKRQEALNLYKIERDSKINKELSEVLNRMYEMGLSQGASSSEFDNFTSGRTREVARLKEAQAKVRNNREWNAFNDEIEKIENEAYILGAKRQKLIRERNKNILAYEVEDTKEFQEIIEKLLTPQEKQFIASQKIWEQRMVREAIKEASLSGATQLRFPTPYTLSVIEGYVTNEKSESSAPYNFNGLDDIILKEGETISDSYDYDELIIVNSTERNITVKPLFEGIAGGKKAVYNKVVNQLLEAKIDFSKPNAEAKYQDFQKNNEVFKSIPFSVITSEDADFVEKVIYRSIEDANINIKELFDIKKDNTLTKQEFEKSKPQVGMYDSAKNRLLVWNAGARETTFGQPYTYKDSTKNKFNIGDLSDTQQTVARKYEEIAEILKKEKPVETITDENGFDWYEAQIEQEDVNKPVVAFQKVAIEPNLSFETPNGETFNSYSQALKNTEEGNIKLKVEDVTLGEVSSSTDINTLLGSINDLVKQGILKGDRLLNPDGTISHVTEGNSLIKKLVNASISEEQFKGNKVKPSVDNRGDISIVKPQSFYEEVKGLEYKQIKAKYGAETASIVLAARIYEDNTKPFGQKRLIEDVQQITPENELQEQLLKLLNTLGIKTVSLAKYNENYKQRNGVLPSSNALADIANRVIAFTNGEVTQDALTEEVSHFIIEASNQEEINPLLENIHKTDEWAQYAEEYFNIYQDEAIVRREILGKVLKNAIQTKFAKSQQTGTANTIIGKLMDLVNKFFTRVSEFLTPQHITDLNEYTQKIYDNLMLGELVDELNQEQLEGNHLVLFQTSKNIQSEADLLLSKLNKALEHVEAQDRRLNSVSKEEILTLKEALKIENTDNEEADIARATLGISNIANRQVNYLEKQAKKNLLSSEESAVFALTAGYLYKVLTELRSIISKKDGMPNKKLISDELDRTIANITKLQGDTNIAQEQNVQRIFEKVGDELGLSDTEKEQLLTNFNNIKRDTNVFYAYVGGAINAHNPALNIASALISKAYADRDIAFNTKMREFMKVTKDAGYTEEQVAELMSKWKRGHFLFSRFDFQKAEKDMLDEKVKLFKEVFGKDVTSTQLEKDEDTLLKAEVTDKKKIYYKKVNDYRQENQVYTPLTEEETRKVNAIYAQVSLETQVKDKEFSRRRSAITREAKRNNGFSELEKFQMEELVRDRAILKNPFDNSGTLKIGLALDEEDNVSIAKGFTLETLDADSKLVYELNLLDRLKGESFKEGVQETAVPLKFIKTLNDIEGDSEKLDFIKANTNISFSSDFWNTFDRSEGVVAKLKDKGDFTTADAIQKLTTRRKHILKANRVFNNPSEVNYADLSGETKKSLLEIEEGLENLYKDANKVLDKEDRVRNEMSESVTNQAYKDEVEDLDLQTTEEIIEFIKQHTTPSNKVKIESARIAVEAYRKGFRKEVPKALQPYITSTEDAEEGLIAYAETKLATYFKKLQPVGFNYDTLLVDIAANPETFFNNMPKDVSVIPNYIFLGQDENSRVNPKFAKNIEDREPQLQLYDKNGNIKYGNEEFAKYFGIADLENPQATKNLKEYDVLTALYKFQDDTIEKADMKDKHSRYLLPQKRPETLNRIANIKADSKGNLKEGFKELFAYREDDAIYGQTDGKMNLGVTAVGEMTIPRHGFNRMETADEVTNELLYSYLWMAQEAELRKSRVGILGDIESIRTILANKSYGDKHGESTETYKMFTDFVNYNMYGQSESFAFETNFGILSKKVNLAPLVKKFQWWIRLVNLGFSVLTPLTSFLQGSVNFQIEKVVGERIDKDASRLARKQLTKLLPETMSDVMKLTSSSKLNIISEFMGQDNSLERFKNSNYNRLTRGMASSAYLTHAAADAPLSAQVMLTVLHDFRVVNGRLTTFAKFAEENKSKTRKEARAAWKSYEDKALFNYITIENGVAKITDELRTEVPDIDIRMQNVRNSISVAKQEVDSQITGTDRTKMQRHALLSFLTLHKGWLITSMTRRFKSKHLNLYTGLEEEGSYSGTFGSDSFFSDLVQDWKKNGMNITSIKDTWNKSSVTRRRSMQRVAADIAVTNALVLIALLLKGAADGDDDKDFATEFAAYMSYRLASEVTSQSTAFSNQIYKFLQSPTTGVTQIQNVLDITDLVSPNIIESGTYKDLSRREAWLFKSLPALKEYWKLTNIDRTRKSYQYFNAPVIDYFSVVGVLMKEDKEKKE